MGEGCPLVARGRPPSGGHRKRQSTARRRGGPARSSDEGPVTGLERRVPGRSGRPEANPHGEEPRGGPKRTVRFHASEAGLWEPYDGRLSRTVLREPGVPTVADRIAQTAAAMLLEEALEPIFHPDSDGYRPGRDGHDALAKARQRCWKQDWVLDLDIRKFFDSVPHGLLTDMVRHHTELRWVRLYIERWLTAPMQMPDGTLVERERGTPQGSPISPLLANLFMHYAFDTWMARQFPSCPFERYADDIVVHCDTEQKARKLWAAIASRLGAFGLELHPD